MTRHNPHERWLNLLWHSVPCLVSVRQQESNHAYSRHRNISLSNRTHILCFQTTEWMLDMRLPENKAKIQNRSINLALSTRGLTALKGTGLALDELIMKSGLPMRGRMLHIGDEGHLVSQDYGVHGEVTTLLVFIHVSIVFIRWFCVVAVGDSYDIGTDFLLARKIVHQLGGSRKVERGPDHGCGGIEQRQGLLQPRPQES